MPLPGSLYQSRAVFQTSPYNTRFGGSANQLRQRAAMGRRGRSGASDIANTIGNWLGVPIAPAPPATTDPTDPNWVPPPSGDNPLPTLATTASFIQNRRYAAGVQAPQIPLSVISSHIDMLPGFGSANVYPIESWPGTTPPGAQAGANFVIVATRTGPTVQDQPLPPNVLWVVDYLPDSPTAPLPPGGQAIPDSPSAAAAATILGMQPMTIGLLALAGVVGVVVLTSHHEKRTRVSRG